MRKKFNMRGTRLENKYEKPHLAILEFNLTGKKAVYFGKSGFLNITVLQTLHEEILHEETKTNTKISVNF